MKKKAIAVCLGIGFALMTIVAPTGTVKSDLPFEHGIKAPQS
ncbi:MAG: hypothetical protein ACI4XL_07225 [Bacillus sp. (in: firmicutes)]